MYILETMTMPEFTKYLRQTKTIVFPFGTIEEHGRHLPLHTDSFIVQQVLLLAAKKRKFFLAPTVPYGVCTATRDHPGTIGIAPETLRTLARDLVSEAHRKGLRNVVLVSGHGGSLHMAALRETAETLVDRLSGLRVAVFSPYDLLWKELSSISETPDDSHAGELETSIMLFLERSTVKGRSPAEYPCFPRPLVVKDKVRYWKGGVWGDPGKATAEKGKRAITVIAEKVIEVIDMMERTR